MSGSMETQIATARRFGARPQLPQPDEKAGVATNVKHERPINGLRHPPTPGTSGWFLWAGGEPSSDPDYFVPLHIAHLESWCPQVVPYLGLPPGWRFLIDEGYEDVWYDASLLVQDH